MASFLPLEALGSRAAFTKEGMGLWLTCLFGRESLEFLGQALGPQAGLRALLGSGAGQEGGGENKTH